MKGIKFGDYHSWDDFSLILSNKTIGSPEPKTETVDIPGADGVLDISEYFGDVKYYNRTLTFEFSAIVAQSQFLNLFSNIQNLLHGKKVRIILDDDPDFYYIGRVLVSEWMAEKSIGKLTIECDCEPYKYKLYKTVISLPIAGSTTVALSNLRKKVTPKITTNAAIQITFGGTTCSVSAGTFILSDIALEAGNNLMTITGTANVKIEYQEGGL